MKRTYKKTRNITRLQRRKSGTIPLRRIDENRTQTDQYEHENNTKNDKRDSNTTAATQKTSTVTWGSATRKRYAEEQAACDLESDFSVVSLGPATKSAAAPKTSHGLSIRREMHLQKIPLTNASRRDVHVNDAEEQRSKEIPSVISDTASGSSTTQILGENHACSQTESGLPSKLQHIAFREELLRQNERNKKHREKTRNKVTENSKTRITYAQQPEESLGKEYSEQHNATLLTVAQPDDARQVPQDSSRNDDSIIPVYPWYCQQWADFTEETPIDDVQAAYSNTCSLWTLKPQDRQSNNVDIVTTYRSNKQRCSLHSLSKK